MSHSRHTCNINGVAGHIGGVRHHHGTRARRHQPLELVVVERAVRVAARMLNGHAPLYRQAVERTQHGVVLEHRYDHAVAGTHHAVNRRVERRRRIGRKTNMVRPRAAQQARKLGTASMNRTSGIEGTRRGPAPGIAERTHRLRHGIDHRLRLMHGRRRVIQVDHRTTSHMSITVKPLGGDARRGKLAAQQVLIRRQRLPRQAAAGSDLPGHGNRTPGKAALDA